MPSAPGRTPIISFPLHMIVIMVVVAPFALAYDRYKTWKWQRERQRMP